MTGDRVLDWFIAYHFWQLKLPRDQRWASVWCDLMGEIARSMTPSEREEHRERQRMRVAYRERMGWGRSSEPSLIK